MAEVRLRPRALRDLEEIVGDVREDNPSRAEARARDIVARLELLAEFPELGGLDRRFRPSVLIPPPGTHLIVTMADTSGGLDVLRILPMRPHWPAALEDVVSV